jgi:solute carrier family 35 protein F1/2
MASYAPAASTPGEEMTVVPEIGRTAAVHTPGLGDGVDDKKQLDTPDEAGDRYPSASFSNEASLDDKASEVADFKKKLPAVEWKNGPRAFFSSLALRIRAAATPRLLLCILTGQILSLCITTTSTVTTELGMGAWSLPATQTFFVYFALMSVYTPLTLYKYGVSAWFKMILTDGWKYFILATIDVFGNFTTVFGFKYTNLLSCLLINAWATPVSMVVCFFLLKSRYHWSQILGVCICIGGLVVLVVSDMRTGKDWGYANKLKGDLFMLLGATLYGISNGLEEFLVRGRPLYEVVGQLGFWGFIINGILVGGYEHGAIHEAVWSGRNVGFLIGYISAMLVLYTLAPILFRFASSPFYNLSLMTSDFYSLLIGLKLFGYKPYYLYFLAYPMVVVGLIVYNLYAPLESHAKTVVKARGRQAEIEETTGRSRVIGAPQGKLGSIL